MGIGVLGPLVVDGGSDRLGPRDRVVLSALVVRRSTAVSSDVLTDALWGDDPPASAGKVVQGCVARLRKALGTSAIETVPHGYRLTVAPDEIDVVHFERLVARAHELLSLGDQYRACFAADEALSLWRGPPLTDVEQWEHGRIEATRLTELHLDAEDLRIEAMQRAGRAREVLAEAQLRAANAPFREHRWVLLARAQYQTGRQAEALATVRRARRMLADELGLDPSPALSDLEDAILHQDPALVASELLDAPSTRCPYPGLVPFDVSDTDAFFGRDADVAECTRRLETTGVVVVVGPSGCGKSSLVRAGVAASLQRGGRRVHVITPGSRPTSTVLPMPTSERAPVLVVDQCEEVVTLCHDADERSRFLDEIEQYADAGGLVVALRADRLGDLAAHPGFARLVERSLFLLRTPSTENLRAAIEGPARQSGLLLEPGLVDVLLRDVEGEPGALPLLSHALQETWERREGRTLTVGGYQATGGIRGAVAQTAERVYNEATEREQSIVRNLMLRLVTPSAGGEPVRNRIPLRLGTTDAERAQVIEVLVRSRLVTSDDGVVELAHEWLAKAWPRLRDWLDDDAEGQRIRRHLTTAAESWAAMGHSASELYRGVRLARALEWRTRTSPDLDDGERSFLDASERLEHDHERDLAERARRQARANRRLRLLASAAAVLGFIAVAGWVAARQEARRADAGAARARSHELAASSTGVLADDPSLAKLLAVASARADDPGLHSIAALHRTWNGDRAVWTYQATEPVGFIWTDLHPSGDRIVSAGLNPHMEPGSTMEVVETFTDEVVWSVDVGAAGGDDPRFVVAPVFADDGDHVVAGVLRDDRHDRTVQTVQSVPRPGHTLGVHVWEATTGGLVEHVDVGPCGAMVIAASASHVLVGTLPEDDGCRWTDDPMAVELVDRDTGEREVLTDDADTLLGAAMSRNGRFVAFERRGSGEIFVVDTLTGERVDPIDGCCVRDVSDDGSLVIGGQSTLHVWDTRTGEAVATFDRHGVRSWFARFEADDRTVLSTGSDGALRRWDAATGEELFSYPSAGNGRPSWTTDGVVLVGQPDHNSATMLDLRARGEIDIIDTCTGFVMSDSLTSAGGVAVVHIDCGDDPDATTHVIDLERREVIHRLRGHMAQSVAIAPLGDRFVRQEGEGTRHGPLVVRAVDTGEKVVELAGTCQWEHQHPQQAHEQDGCELFPAEPFGVWPQRLRWSPDGSMIAVAFSAGFAAWDADTGALLHTEASIGEGFDAVFTPDSSHVTVTAGRSIRTLSTVTWEPVIERELSIDDGMFLGLAGYTPDGSNLLVVEALIGQTAGSVHWFHPDSLLPGRSRKQAHDGSIRAVDLASDGTRLATASADGVVRIWDVDTGDLVHEVPFPSGIRGVAFVDDTHLAVVPNDGDVLIVTTDVDELVEIVAASLSRGFRPTECVRFGFGDHCPTVAELR